MEIRVGLLFLLSLLLRLSLRSPFQTDIPFWYHIILQTNRSKVHILMFLSPVSSPHPHPRKRRDAKNRRRKGGFELSREVLDRSKDKAESGIKIILRLENKSSFFFHSSIEHVHTSWHFRWQCRSAYQ